MNLKQNDDWVNFEETFTSIIDANAHAEYMQECMDNKFNYCLVWVNDESCFIELPERIAEDWQEYCEKDKKRNDQKKGRETYTLLVSFYDPEGMLREEMIECHKVGNPTFQIEMDNCLLTLDLI